MLNWQDLPWGFVINKIKIKLKIQSFHLNPVKSNDGKFGFRYDTEEKYLAAFQGNLFKFSCYASRQFLL